MTVARLRVEMSSQELTEWRAYDEWEYERYQREQKNAQRASRRSRDGDRVGPTDEQLQASD